LNARDILLSRIDGVLRTRFDQRLNGLTCLLKETAPKLRFDLIDEICFGGVDAELYNAVLAAIETAGRLYCNLGDLEKVLIRGGKSFEWAPKLCSVLVDELGQLVPDSEPKQLNEIQFRLYSYLNQFLRGKSLYAACAGFLIYNGVCPPAKLNLSEEFEACEISTADSRGLENLRHQFYTFRKRYQNEYPKKIKATFREIDEQVALFAEEGEFILKTTQLNTGLKGCWTVLDALKSEKLL
jgi:hypothetical protein